MDLLAGYQAAREWLLRGGDQGLREQPPHLLYRRREPDNRWAKDVAVTVETATTLANSTAQGRLNQLVAWRDAAPHDRWVVLCMPQTVGEIELLQVKGFDQVVRWPLVGYYPATS